MENKKSVIKYLLGPLMLILALLLVLLPIMLEACSSILSPRKSEDTAKVWCLIRNKNEVIIRVENVGTEPIYVPEEFWLQYSNSQDTLFFESIYKKKYNERAFYYYNQFGANDVTGIPIEGLQPTSVKREEIEVKYNQFIAPRLIELKPKSHIIKVQKFNIPFGVTDVVVKLYRSNFTLKSYSYNDFIKFEKENSFEIYSRLYEALDKP